MAILNRIADALISSEKEILEGALPAPGNQTNTHFSVIDR